MYWKLDQTLFDSVNAALVNLGLSESMDFTPFQDVQFALNNKSGYSVQQCNIQIPQEKSPEDKLTFEQKAYSFLLIRI